VGIENRKQPRVSGYAKALLLGPMAPGWVRDLSRSGCQVAFMQAVDVKVGDTVMLKIIAEHDPSIAPFEIRLHVRWMKPDPIWHSFGGEIDSPAGSEGVEVFEKLVDYYPGAGT
jgi:hypothetical protein